MRPIRFFYIFVWKIIFSCKENKQYYNNNDEKIKLYSKNLPILEDDTQNVIEYVKQTKKKRKKSLIFGNF